MGQFSFPTTTERGQGLRRFDLGSGMEGAGKQSNPMQCSEVQSKNNSTMLVDDQVSVLGSNEVKLRRMQRGQNRSAMEEDSMQDNKYVSSEVKQG